MSTTDAAKEEAKGLLARWRAERRDIGAAARELSRQSMALSKMIEGMESLYPELKTNPFSADLSALESKDSADPAAEPTEITTADLGESAADVARLIVRENPTKWFTTGDMVREFAARHHPATPTAIRLGLRKTWEEGLSEKRGDGRGQMFRLRTEEPGDADLGVFTP